jgi:hypothetical protein
MRRSSFPRDFFVFEHPHTNNNDCRWRRRVMRDVLLAKTISAKLDLSELGAHRPPTGMSDGMVEWHGVDGSAHFHKFVIMHMNNLCSICVHDHTSYLCFSIVAWLAAILFYIHCAWTLALEGLHELEGVKTRGPVSSPNRKKNIADDGSSPKCRKFSRIQVFSKP